MLYSLQKKLETIFHVFSDLPICLARGHLIHDRGHRHWILEHCTPVQNVVTFQQVKLDMIDISSNQDMSITTEIEHIKV